MAAVDAPSNKATGQHAEFLGVYEKEGLWETRICINGAITNVSVFCSAAAAARLYDVVALASQGPSTQLNFDVNDYDDEMNNIASLVLHSAEWPKKAREIAGRITLRAVDASEEQPPRAPEVEEMRFKGVYKLKNESYRSVISIRQKNFELGHYTTAVEAARMYDVAVLARGNQSTVQTTNFTYSDYVPFSDRISALNFDHPNLFVEQAREIAAAVRDSSEKDVAPKRRRVDGGQFAGVWPCAKDPTMWEACLRVRNNTVSLGVFASAREAAVVRDVAAIRFRSPETELNFPMVTYAPFATDIDKIDLCGKDWTSDLCKVARTLERGCTPETIPAMPECEPKTCLDIVSGVKAHRARLVGFMNDYLKFLECSGQVLLTEDRAKEADAELIAKEQAIHKEMQEIQQQYGAPSIPREGDDALSLHIANTIKMSNSMDECVVKMRHTCAMRVQLHKRLVDSRALKPVVEEEMAHVRNLIGKLPS